MARHVEEPGWVLNAHNAEHLRVCDQVEHLIGWRPESVRMVKGRFGDCAFAKVPMGLRCTVEFIVNNGLLVGIHPLTKR